MPSDSVQVSFSIRNTGSMAGDEVPQLYLHDVESSITVYEKMLRGFERVHLEPGQQKTVTMTLRNEDLAMLDRNMKEIVEPGIFEVFIGSSSTDFRLGGKFTVIDPANPDRQFSSENEAGLDRLPLTMKKGDEITFSIKSDVVFSSFNIQWGQDSDCSYEIQMNRGGGQFGTVASGSTKGGLAKPQMSYPKSGSDVRVVITEGQGTLTWFYCAGMK